MKHYVIEMRDAIRAIGPFDTDAAGDAWGRDPVNNPDDHANWQVVALEGVGDCIVIPVVAPEQQS